jgi:hypothetical protein
VPDVFGKQRQRSALISGAGSCFWKTTATLGVDFWRWILFLKNNGNTGR